MSPQAISYRVHNYPITIITYSHNSRTPGINLWLRFWCFWGEAVDGEGDGFLQPQCWGGCYPGPTSGGLTPGHWRGSSPSPPHRPWWHCIVMLSRSSIAIALWRIHCFFVKPVVADHYHMCCRQFSHNKTKEATLGWRGAFFYRSLCCYTARLFSFLLTHLHRPG